jgi:hypothetical protein
MEGLSFQMFKNNSLSLNDSFSKIDKNDDTKKNENPSVIKKTEEKEIDFMENSFIKEISKPKEIDSKCATFQYNKSWSEAFQSLGSFPSTSFFKPAIPPSPCTSFSSFIYPPPVKHRYSGNDSFYSFKMTSLMELSDKIPIHPFFFIPQLNRLLPLQHSDREIFTPGTNIPSSSDLQLSTTPLLLSTFQYINGPRLLAARFPVQMFFCVTPHENFSLYIYIHIYVLKFLFLFFFFLVVQQRI